MRTIGLAALVAMLTTIAAGGGRAMAQDATCVHVSTSFNFEVRAEFARAAQLFGPESEKGWAGERWQPKFAYPQPGSDVPGTVFTTQHGPHTSIWVNTLYDVADGRMQYVAVIPGVVATVVDVRLKSEGSDATKVAVTYVRTALDAAVNEDVRRMAEHDAVSGPEWQEAIAALLASQADGKQRESR